MKDKYSLDKIIDLLTVIKSIFFVGWFLIDDYFVLFFQVKTIYCSNNLF